ncbi:class I SAM-dependent methyltransferase [Nostocoides australiense]|uniref:class I SAM-dependent methyltransferase n=1 Tax=Nostocoides australiense TaxID=99480 RepID=UPI00065FBF44|nr:methyltransferase domain-containing protein [Tetrasphaera australiensis]
MTSDPNDPIALALRARTLAAAFRPPVSDRLGYVEDRCRGRKVLDIGAVAHDSERMDSPSWLHGRIAAVAASCLAVDILPAGVAAMQKRGFEAVTHDLSAGPGPLRERGPFDVIVAGELIEHVTDLGMLFRTATDLLSPAGEMLITTPNPFAPKRMWAGRRGMVWENADHILLAFPAGMAELAERHDLLLAEAFTVVPARPPVTARSVAKRVLRSARGTAWRTTGFTTSGARVATRIQSGLTRPPSRRDWFRGETFIYVIRRPDALS